MEFRVRRAGGTKGGRTKAGLGTAGKVFVSLFLSVFFVAGLFMLAALAIDTGRLLMTYTWEQVPCVVESSRMLDRPTSGGNPYGFEVTYRYTIEGVEYRSDLYTQKYDGSDTVTEPQRLVRKFATGVQTYCYVDADDPKQAVLRRDRLRGVFWLLVPFAFIVPGLGGIVLLWWPFGGSDAGGVARSKKAAAIESISEKKLGSSPWAGRGCLALFFGVFLAAGLGFFIPFFAIPYYRVLDARDWTELPCTVEKAWVESHPGDDSTTYSIGVLYSYQVGDQTLRSDRYSFATGSDSGYEKKQKIVEGLPAGTRTVCWVDPDDPLSAVLSRSGPPWWLGLILLPFVLVGGGGVAFALFGGSKATGTRFRSRRSRRPRDETPVAERPRDLLGAAFDERAKNAERSPSAEERVLEPSAGPVAKFWGLLFVCLFWNGIVGVFVFQLVKSFQEGNTDGCLALFIIPFVLVGLLLLVAVPHQFLAIFNPRPILSLVPGFVRTGEATNLRWRFTGASGRLTGLTVVLEGIESARYRQGTDTSTATEVFYSQTLVEREGGMSLGEGEVRLEVPGTMMHSFDAGNNEILWKLKLSGEIRYWPDIAYEYPVDVEPGGGES